MKKNIAYKIAKNVEGLPDGAVTDNFETDDENLDGYIIVPRDSFEAVMKKNRDLLLAYQNNVHGNLPVATNRGSAISPELKKDQQKKAEADAALFAQFLAWKNSQSST